MKYQFIETQLQETGLSLILIYTGVKMEESYLGKCQCIHCHEVKSHKGIFVHVDRAHLGSTKYIGTTGKKKIHGKSTQIESTNYCCYGCGNLAKFLSPSGKEMCDSSANKCPINRKKNSDSLVEDYKSGKRQPYNYDDLPQETKDKMSWNKGKIVSEPRFEYGGVGNHKKTLIQERGHVCEICGICTWQGKEIILELDHINGDNKDNVRSNLRLLCPNCHSQTDTWRGRNKNSGKVKVTDAELIEALSEQTSIRQALLKVGLAAKGANYVRCHDMIHGGLVKLATTAGLSPAASA